jgi:LysR family transcriptional regulator for metE and metH
MRFAHGVIPRPILETRDLRLVLAIDERGGATGAARALHVSQSAVSHQLRGLEERLGLALFEREGRRLRITSAGERIVRLSREILAPLAQAELELKRGGSVQRRTLRIATECYTSYHWLPQALSVLAALHPVVDLGIVAEAASDIPGALAENRLDLGLCVSPPTAGRLERRKLFDDELVLAVPRGHPLGRKAFVEGRDLLSETLILSETTRAERERVAKLLFRPGESVARVIRLPVAEAILELVQAGVGVSVVANFTLRRYVERGDLQAVRITRRGLRRAWTGVFRRGSPLAGPITTLLDALHRQGTS